MADREMDVYLNDHLAGATLGADLAQQIQQRHENSPLGELMAQIATEIEEDRQTLVDLMQRMDVTRNPLKQAAGWVAEKASQLKFSGAGSGAPDQGAFMALESLALGVLGKRKLWAALKAVKDQYPALTATDLDELIVRADAQHDALDRERTAAAVVALGHGASSA